MKIKKLQQAIETLSSRPEWSSSEARQDIELLETLLHDHQDLSISEFCVRASAGLKANPTRKKAAKPSKGTVELATVRRYASELERTKSQNSAFEAVVARMKKDKSVRVGEAKEIAKRFVGGTRRYKTKGETFKAILHRQISDARAANKVTQIPDIL